tara:strand:- start:184 stop:594 length:411 start_codon:yes stop_codon:yes gene_type:complete
MNSKKNIKLGKNKFYLTILFICFVLFNFYTHVKSKIIESDKFVEIKILDKVSSKNSKLELEIGKEKRFKDLVIKALKCRNSQFDDNPEITAYLQVKDLSNKSNDEVFVFNGWTFSSSPSIKPFDHPIYDIWLTKCF